MYIRPSKDGKKIQYVEKYRDPMTNKWKQVTVTLPKDNAANRRLATEELNRKIQVACTACNRDLSTLKLLLDNYIAFQRKTLKLSTCERNERTLRKLVDILGPDCLLDNLTVSYITTKLLAMNKEPSTLNEYIRRLKAMLNWGYIHDYVKERAVIDKLQPFVEKQTKREKIEFKFLEPEELTILLKYMKDTNKWEWYYLTKFLALTGLRIGEAMALTPSDISNDYIHIDKTYDVVNNIVTTPKTLTSNRDVYIQDELSDLLKQYKIWRSQTDLLYGIRSKLFFHSSKGTCISYYSYTKYIKELGVRLLKREKITPHIFRHTHASLLMADGVSIEAISRRLGHENSSITKEIYLHVVEKLKEKDNEQIKNVRLL